MDGDTLPEIVQTLEELSPAVLSVGGPLPGQVIEEAVDHPGGGPLHPGGGPLHPGGGPLHPGGGLDHPAHAGAPDPPVLGTVEGPPPPVITEPLVLLEGGHTQGHLGEVSQGVQILKQKEEALKRGEESVHC